MVEPGFSKFAKHKTAIVEPSPKNQMVKPVGRGLLSLFVQGKESAAGDLRKELALNSVVTIGAGEGALRQLPPSRPPSDWSIEEFQEVAGTQESYVLSELRLQGRLPSAESPEVSPSSLLPSVEPKVAFQIPKDLVWTRDWSPWSSQKQDGASLRSASPNIARAPSPPILRSSWLSNLRSALCATFGRATAKVLPLDHDNPSRLYVSDKGASQKGAVYTRKYSREANLQSLNSRTYEKRLLEGIAEEKELVLKRVHCRKL